MHVPDWAHLGWAYYLVIGGGILAVLAILLYLVAGSRLKTLAIVASALGGLAAGGGLGILIMSNVQLPVDTGYQASGTAGPEGLPKAGPRPGGSGMMKGGMAKGGGMPKGGPGMGGTPGGRKGQLVSLVYKLNQLTGKPLEIHLSEDQKKRLRAILAGLDGPSELSEEEARKKLDALQDVVKPDEETLKAATLHWPQELIDHTDPRTPLTGNPFHRYPAARQQLKELEDRLAKGSAR